MAKMRAGREDRRVTYTKNAIKDALLELMKEKSFEKLSISKVCEAAQITRTTFYSHYDTLNQVLDELIDEAFEVAEYSSTTLSMSLPQRLHYLLQFDTVETLREHNSDLPTCQRIADMPKYRILFQDRTLSEYIKNKLFRMMKPSVIPELMEYCCISQTEAERFFATCFPAPMRRTVLSTGSKMTNGLFHGLLSFGWKQLESKPLGQPISRKREHKKAEHC